MNFELERYLKEINQHYKTLSMMEMEAYLTDLIERVAKEYGEESAGFASLLNELGGYYRGVSQYAKAEEAFAKAERIICLADGEDNPNYATTINNLAGVHRLTGSFSKAEQLFLKAIRIYKATGYGESFAYSSALNNLGLIYLDQKEYGKAAGLFEESRVITQKTNGHPVIYATGLSNLASAYLGLSRFSDAEKMLLEAIEVYQTNKLEKNIHYASAINSLGLFYFSIENYPKAEYFFLQALDLRERDFGRDNHEFAKASDNLSTVYEKTGNFEKAEKHIRQASAAYRAVLGEESAPYRSAVESLQRIQSKRRNDGTETPLIRIGSTDTAGCPPGMELALMCFAQFCATTLCKQFPEYSDRIAAGLVGEGSECYGFDDEISRDHDWGPSFCLWLTQRDFETIGPELQREYEKLSQNFFGLKMTAESAESAGRRGVLEINSFYRKYIGLDRAPASLREWRAIPESNLSVVTNGKVFVDELREFSRFRDELKAFYPEDIRLKKIAARCAIMGQAGQYNYSRSIQRSEYVAANHALTSFIDAAISTVFLLNKEYKPFYKWMHRGLKTLPILGTAMYGKLSELTAENKGSEASVFERRNGLIEELSQRVIQEITRQGMSQSNSDFLLDHAHQIQKNIQDPDIRAMHVMTD